MSISNNALIFYHTYTIESKKKSVYFTDFSIKSSFSLEYRDGFEGLLGYHRKQLAYSCWEKESIAKTLGRSETCRS